MHRLLTISALLSGVPLLSLTASAQQPLKDGVSVRDSVNKQRLTHYAIKVPEGALGMQVMLHNLGESDADLYIRKDKKPSRDKWDFRPYVTGADELVTLDSNSSPKLKPGATYHIGVTTNGEEKASYSLVAKFIFRNKDGGAPSATRRYRVVWVNDPSTTATIAWEQVSGKAATVHYGTEDKGTNATQYPATSETGREVRHHGMRNCFAHLRNLKPDTDYYFVIQDQSGTSDRLYFHTAPAKERPFTFCAGGDSRNFRAPRQQANRTVAKLRPLFVAFTGDMINTDTPLEWQEWLDDWQQTITPDGRIFPILPHRGNHETSNKSVYEIFDTTPDNYYALSIAGDLMRFYVLNSEISAAGKQLEWLKGDLDKHASSTRHLVVGYHKPMRPVVAAKTEGTDEYDNWAPLFYHYGIDLAFESDSHAVKRTQPLKPSTGPGSTEGFIISNNDPKATVYTGEGCWGAPLRKADDTKPWLLAADSFNSFDWVQVYPDRMELRTVKVSESERNIVPNKDDNPLTIPAGLDLWQPASGSVLSIPGD